LQIAVGRAGDATVAIGRADAVVARTLALPVLAIAVHTVVVTATSHQQRAERKTLSITAKDFG
jgi:hypothetical protein